MTSNQLQRATLMETRRANLVNEAIKQGQLSEEIRNNKRNYLINLDKNDIQKLANDELNFRELRKLAETVRHNAQEEYLKNKSIENDYYLKLANQGLQEVMNTRNNKTQKTSAILGMLGRILGGGAMAAFLRSKDDGHDDGSTSQEKDELDELRDKWEQVGKDIADNNEDDAIGILNEQLRVNDLKENPALWASVIGSVITGLGILSGTMSGVPVMSISPVLNPNLNTGGDTPVYSQTQTQKSDSLNQANNNVRGDQIYEEEKFQSRRVIPEGIREPKVQEFISNSANGTSGGNDVSKHPSYSQNAPGLTESETRDRPSGTVIGPHLDISSHGTTSDSGPSSFSESRGPSYDYEHSNGPYSTTSSRGNFYN